MRTLLLGLAALTTVGQVSRPPRLRSKAEPLPVERLVENLTAALQKDRDNHELHFSLGRVHYLAFANQALMLPSRAGRDRVQRAGSRAEVGAYFLHRLHIEAERRARSKLGIDELTEPDAKTRSMLAKVTLAQQRQLIAANWTPPADQRTMQRHAELALQHFETAIRIRPENGLYRLGLASLSEQALDFEANDKLPKRRSFKGYAELTYAVVRDRYREAFLCASKERREPDKIAGDVVWEAASGYLRIVERDEELRSGQDNWLEVTRAATANTAPRIAGPLTPIVFGDRAEQRLADLLHPDSDVQFDLDGDGRRESWGWIRTDAHLLVWDPVATGDIRSGRQLFGSVTWFLFHRDGYAALRLLDNDGDGRLRGWELDGLAMWTDRDGDGSSDASEVQPLWRIGVREVGLAAGRDEAGVLTASCGLRFADGRVLPTFDWEATPR